MINLKNKFYERNVRHHDRVLSNKMKSYNLTLMIIFNFISNTI